jgi:hypothetical protein
MEDVMLTEFRHPAMPMVAIRSISPQFRRFACTFGLEKRRRLWYENQP